MGGQGIPAQVLSRLPQRKRLHLQSKDAADVQALSDAQAKAASDLAGVQASLDAMTAKEQVEEGLVTGLQGSISALQSSLDAIKAAVAAVLTPPAA